MQKYFNNSWKVLLGSLLVIAEGITVQNITGFFGNYSCFYVGAKDFIFPCNALGFFILAFCLIGSLALVQLLWAGVEKIIKWRKTPSPKNVRLFCLPLTNNEIRLAIKNLEFRKPQVMVSKVEIGINGQRYLASVIHNNTVLKFLKSVEVPFLKLIPTEGKFQVIYHESENQQEFRVGTYNFDVIVHYGYSTPREGLLSRYEVAVEFSSGVLKIVSIQATAT